MTAPRYRIIWRNASGTWTGSWMPNLDAVLRAISTVHSSYPWVRAVRVERLS
jgi:hypothetical protein